MAPLTDVLLAAGSIVTLWDWPRLRHLGLNIGWYYRTSLRDVVASGTDAHSAPQSGIMVSDLGCATGAIWHRKEKTFPLLLDLIMLSH